MSRFQWIIVSFVLSLGLILGVALLRLDSLTPVQSAEEHAEGGEQEENHQHSAQGPHEGLLLEDAKMPFKLEVVSREKGKGKLELHFYALADGNKTLEPQQGQLQVIWKRLGKAYPLNFKIQEQSWIAQSLIDEPHSFELEAKLIFQGKTANFHWEKHENRLELTREQLRESNIGFARAGSRFLSDTLQLPGKIAVDQDRYVHLTPRISGLVTRVFRHLGENVSKGEVLAVIESRELGDLRLDYQQSTQRYAQARKRYEYERGFFSNTTLLIRGLQKGENIESLHQELLGLAIGTDRQNLLKAYSEWRLANQNYQREKTLLTQKVTSQAEYQQAEQIFLETRSAYQAVIEEAERSRRLQLLEREQEMRSLAPAADMARQKLQSLGLDTKGTSIRYELRSPINGTIISKHIAAGESLQADADAFLIADLSQVWAEMMIPESQLESVRLGQRVEIISQTGKYSTGGIVSHLGATVDESSRTAESHAEVLNSQRIWKPGMFVTVQLQSNPYRVSLAVPAAAIQTLEGEDVVFVRDEEALQAVPVELGRRSQDWVEVREGLEAGMAYVSNNSFLLKAEIEKSTASHSH